MKYSRNKINKFGKALLAGPETGFPYTDANLVVEDWRKFHMIPLQELVAEVTRVLSEAGVIALFSSYRLKRMTSIIGKLRHNSGMGLGGLQDIGGARFVFEDISSLLKAQQIISQASLEHFVIDREPYDYVVKPKASGYRSIHFAYKFVSDNDDYDGLGTFSLYALHNALDGALAEVSRVGFHRQPINAYRYRLSHSLG